MWLLQNADNSRSADIQKTKGPVLYSRTTAVLTNSLEDMWKSKKRIVVELQEAHALVPHI